MSAYPFFNEVGEPLMDGAAMRTEMYYDSMGEYDPDYYLSSWDDYDDEYAEPTTCAHGDGSYPEGAGFDCDNCGELLLGPRTAPVEYAGVDWDSFFVKR